MRTIGVWVGLGMGARFQTRESGPVSEYQPHLAQALELIRGSTRRIAVQLSVGPKPGELALPDVGEPE